MDRRDSCEVSRTSLETSRLAVHSLGGLGTGRIAVKSLVRPNTSRIAVKELGRVLGQQGSCLVYWMSLVSAG